jgi:hypothetical protein
LHLKVINRLPFQKILQTILKGIINESKENEKIMVEPNIIKYAGYEIGRLNIFKLRIINKTSKSSQMQIIPPRSFLFQLRYDTNSVLAQQTADIFVYFQPHEYK